MATDERSGAGTTGAVGASGSPDTHDLELELARQRLAFYESFDHLIQENIARSGDLLRQAVALRENASREIEEARVAAEARVADERQRHRAVFAALLDELTQLQQQADRLTRRVGETLATIDTPAAAAAAATQAAIETVPPSPSAADVAEPAVEVAAEPRAEAPTEETVAAAPAEVVAVEDVVVPAEPAAPSAAEEVVVERSAEAQAEAVPADVVPPAAVEPVAELVAEPVAQPEAAPVAAETLPRAVTVLVHGVPRATAALSLQRHLAGLRQVDAVEAREYAEGILRLHVTVRGPLAVDDLRSWEGGAELEPVHVLRDVIEVRLPGAAGL